MVFSSLSFTILFMPFTALLYFCMPTRDAKNFFIMLASLFFYAWGEPKFVLIMIVVALVTYLFGILIDRNEKNKKLFFVVGIICIFSALFIYKYLNFFCGKAIIKSELPIGISFYTFQSVSYVIDLYRGDIKVQKNPFNLLMYICFFPQLIAGPVVRYSTIEFEINNRCENKEDIVYGTKRFIIGLSKKVLLANFLAKFAEIVYSGSHGSFDSMMYWLASLAYTLEIYYDFSGYSDMAIGLGRIFGFHFLENFNYPYSSTSVTDFWRRWHISLSSWFKDYVYIPLGGSRVGSVRYVINILIVWLLTGLWHGASVNFIFWGLYYAVFLIFEKYVMSKLLSRIPRFISWAYTFFVVDIGWMLFNLTDLSEFAYALKMMFSNVHYDLLDMISYNTQLLYTVLFIPIGIALMFPKKKEVHNIVCFILLILDIAVILSSSYNPFIYFRF